MLSLGSLKADSNVSHPEFLPQEATLGGPAEDQLVIGDAAVNDRLPAGVDNDEGQMDDRVGRRWPAGLLLCLAVPLHQVLEGDLLKKTNGAPGDVNTSNVMAILPADRGTWGVRDQPAAALTSADRQPTATGSPGNAVTSARPTLVTAVGWNDLLEDTESWANSAPGRAQRSSLCILQG